MRRTGASADEHAEVGGRRLGAGRAGRGLAGGVALALVLTGCASIPSDPDHTLERIRRDRVLRLGVSPNPPWTVAEGATATGSEVDLVRGFADKQGARLEIVVGGEEPLVQRLEDGELDLVVGGLTTENTATSRFAKTRAYAQTTDAHGRREKHIMAAPLGENRLLSELERHLDAATGRTR